MEKDCKAYKALKNNKSKKSFERLHAIQKELQSSISEVRWQCHALKISLSLGFELFSFLFSRLTVRGKSTLRKKVLPLTSGTMPKTQRTGNLLFVAFMYGTKGGDMPGMSLNNLNRAISPYCFFENGH